MARTTPDIQKKYPGRPKDTMPVGVNLPRSAVEILRRHSPNGFYGQFMASIMGSATPQWPVSSGKKTETPESQGP